MNKRQAIKIVRRHADGFPYRMQTIKPALVIASRGLPYGYSGLARIVRAMNYLTGRFRILGHAFESAAVPLGWFTAAGSFVETHPFQETNIRHWQQCASEPATEVRPDDPRITT